MLVLPVFLCFIFFFFFQAEDGIRDPLVTGVQTCALPILYPLYVGAGKLAALLHLGFTTVFVVMEWLGRLALLGAIYAFTSCFVRERSEERRVGKECRSRWSAYH